MRGEELAFAIDLAAGEGWNPGVHDAECFFAADPNGFPIGCLWVYSSRPVSFRFVIGIDFGGSFRSLLFPTLLRYSAVLAAKFSGTTGFVSTWQVKVVLYRHVHGGTVVNFGTGSWWAWVLPTIVGTPIIAWITREAVAGRTPKYV